MADEVPYVLDGEGYSLHWEVQAEIAERYYARIAKEPTRHEISKGDTLYVPQNTSPSTSPPTARRCTCCPRRTACSRPSATTTSSTSRTPRSSSGWPARPRARGILGLPGGAGRRPWPPDVRVARSPGHRVQLAQGARQVPGVRDDVVLARVAHLREVVAAGRVEGHRYGRTPVAGLGQRPGGIGDRVVE